MVAIEAAAAGLPIVATRRGSLPEIVRDGETGLLVNPYDPDDLAQKLLRLINDPGLRERLGTAAQTQVWRSFTQKRMVNEFESLCTEVNAV